MHLQGLHSVAHALLFPNPVAAPLSVMSVDCRLRLIFSFFFF